MKKKRVNLWLVLPEELVSQIMASSRLDLRSMIKCMGVCKQWRNLISDLISANPLLTKGHAQFFVQDFPLARFGALDDKTHQISWGKTLVTELGDEEDDRRGGSGSWIKPDPPRVKSTCNGLVCLVGGYKRDIYICNPMTGENISLTTPKHHWHSTSIGRYELGFSPSSNEYKLTAFTINALEICTLGGASRWRSVPCELRGLDTQVCAVLVSGVFHLLLKTRNILTLDLAKEVFGSIPLPCLEADKKVYQLECMEHCLVVTAGYYPPLDSEIWMRNEDKSSGDSVWTKNWVIDTAESMVCDFSFYRCLKPRKLLSDGRVFMTHLHTDLYSYDPRDKLVRHHYTGGELHAYYTPTLVSPKKLMQVNGREGTKIEKIGD